MQKRVVKFVIVIAFTGLPAIASAPAAEVYSGEPLGEALVDLSKAALVVSHENVAASPLRRCDVFRFGDGRLLAITSRARKLGEPYTIETLRVTSSAEQKLSKNLPAVRTVQFPDHR
ncbi:MAG: hypothetical protein ACJ8NS_04515 [Chthoniobacterales bacterium]